MTNETIIVLYRATGYDGDRIPVAVHVAGEAQYLDDPNAPEFERIDEAHVTIDGTPYQFVKRAGERKAGREGQVDVWEFGAMYRKLEGWQVLINGQPIARDMRGRNRMPVASRAEAETIARDIALNQLAGGCRVTAEVAYRDGFDLGAVVSRIDTAGLTPERALALGNGGGRLPIVRLDDGDDGPTASPDAPPDGNQKGTGETPSSPAPGSDNESETNQDHHTTNGAGRQVVLTVEYAGTPPSPTETLATGQLIAYSDGNGNKRPAHSLPEIRLELNRRGYRPDYTLWTVKAGSTVRREVFVLGADADTPIDVTAAYAELKAAAGKHTPSPLVIDAPYTPPEPPKRDPWDRSSGLNSSFCRENASPRLLGWSRS